jgi:hypothetical protein
MEEAFQGVHALQQLGVVGRLGPPVKRQCRFSSLSLSPRHRHRLIFSLQSLMTQNGLSYSAQPDISTPRYILVVAILPPQLLHHFPTNVPNSSGIFNLSCFQYPLSAP